MNGQLNGFHEVFIEEGTFLFTSESVGEGHPGAARAGRGRAASAQARPGIGVGRGGKEEDEDEDGEDGDEGGTRMRMEGPRLGRRFVCVWGRGGR
ncbi:hypothetical protein WISP_00430 [Willisornis vidua]|uniref:Uncharacterized protein n=1 Tax=Willisornis vidua TaxID=1566151 RepID=A0ABQ9DYN7_9PASS|nr:hypothetical protein WISP_00430 [Willisornis vidua]